jgi:ketosteroid isomerase-like protein
MEKSMPTHLRKQVIATENAFAETMANRDFEAFRSFISEEAIFFSEEKPLHGKEEVLNEWQKNFIKAEAPFSWKPERVEVIDSGTLALSTGPVHDPQGKLIARFTSIWRMEENGKWRILFDIGNPAIDKAEVKSPRSGNKIQKEKSSNKL